ncbi:MAG: hypothetical protein II776_01225, partial [Clostridia bacterium]|nr:hypothetical protein [Clostridia bacterium]
DPDESYVMMQEQAANDIEDTSSGVKMIRCGNPEKKYTFADLFNKGYIAVTTAEFLGQAAYEPCRVTFEGDGNTLEGITAGTFRSNYPMAVLRVILRADSGDTVLKQILFSRADIGSGRALDFTLTGEGAALDRDRRVPSSGAYTLSVEITTATGEVFTPVEFTSAS